MSQFAFLKSDFADVHEHAVKAESLAKADPRGACFYARLALETTVKWVYRNDGSLGTPYESTLSAMINHSSFRRAAGEAMVAKAKVIQKRGNFAVHDSRQVRSDDAVAVVRELWHISFWLVRTYGLGGTPDPGTQFSIDALPQLAQVPATSLQQALALAKHHKAETEKRKQAEEALKASESERERFEAELKAARAEIAKIKAENAQVEDRHDYNEEQTRDHLIDLLLHEAGWQLNKPEDIEFEVAGMPTSSDNPRGRGFVDYVLWGDDGKPLAVVEAKRTKRDPREGQHQAKLYADCLEERFGQRPLIFYTNGYQHEFWDDQRHPPRAVQGFYKKSELALLIQRRSRREPLKSVNINEKIAGRYYQGRAIRRVGEAYDEEARRRALLVMATGTGKTRTAIALTDVLMRANWAKRVLFLADRRALVKQAYNAFKEHLPQTTLATTNMPHDTNNDTVNARVLVATYPSMMARIDKYEDGVRDFGIGHFDLIIVDEAHRSIYKKFGAIFDYFDSHILGLTATPKDEVDRDTYKMFDLQRGVPTDAYMLDEAVADGYLAPPMPISVPIKFQRDGIRYEELSEEEKDEWDALEWNEEGEVPDSVDAQAINDWLFNKDTVEKVLAYLMENGIRVEDGDRLGKTIVFAKNDKHAQFIADRFNANYPHYRGHFAKVITYKTERSESLIDDFSEADKDPHIAISVDMLDTGVDVPEIVNLVFFKLVRSKTKFWQMIGRGTRLSDDLFGPGQHKEHFAVFDFCQNFEFFNANPDVKEPRLAPSLSERLFVRRLELLSTLAGQDNPAEPQVGEEQQPFETGADEGGAALRGELVDLLHAEVQAMNFDNFIVRPKRRQIEPFKTKGRWTYLSQDDLHVLAHEIAGLPTEREDEHISAKQFDNLIVSAQLALLRREGAFSKLKDRIVETGKALEQLAHLPQVTRRLELIVEVQSPSFWDGINLEMLETVRLELRDLVKLIEPRKRKQVYTDFEDEIGVGVETVISGAEAGTNMVKFRAKTRRFLEDHQDHISVQKLRRNQQLTPTDFEELERIMVEQAGVTDEDFEFVRNETEGLGLFIRGLVGLEQGAVKEAFSEFLSPTTASANQIEFINLVVDHLCQAGTLDPARLYESPFTDRAPNGLDSVFDDEGADRVVTILRQIKQHAEPISLAGAMIAK